MKQSLQTAAIVFMCVFVGFLAGYKYAEYNEIKTYSVNEYNPPIHFHGSFNDAVRWEAELRVVDKVPERAHLDLMRTVTTIQYEYSSEQYDEFVRAAEDAISNILDAHHISWEYLTITKEEL